MRTKRAENGLDQSMFQKKSDFSRNRRREAQLGGRAQVTVDLGLPQRTDLGTFLENENDQKLSVARRPVVWRTNAVRMYRKSDVEVRRRVAVPFTLFPGRRRD